MEKEKETIGGKKKRGVRNKGKVRHSNKRLKTKVRPLMTCPSLFTTLPPRLGTIPALSSKGISTSIGRLL